MPSIVWKGHLTFGLVSIPVKLFRAARRERVRLHYVHRPAVADRDSDATPEYPADLAQEASVGGQQKVEIAPPEPEPEPALVAPISRVRQALVTSDGEESIGRAEVFKGYEVEPDHYVVLDPEELRGLQRRTSPNMEIVRSVKLSEIDPVFFETSYYL